MAKEVWDTPNPKKKSSKLTPEQKAQAKARAKKATVESSTEAVAE